MNLSQAVKLALGATLLEAVDPDEAEAMYVGPKAKGWDALKNKFTSLFDKMERAEISDRTSGILKGQLDRDNAYKLEDVYSHPELYEQYPFLKDIDVYPVLGSKSSYQPGIINIGVTNYRTPSKSSYLHEIQHAIQDKEGWARGSSPWEYNSNLNIELGNRSNDLFKWSSDKEIQAIANASKKGDIKRVLELKKQDEEAYNIATRLYKELGEYPTSDVLLKESARLSKEADKVTPMAQYLRTSGEIEARDTASRMNLTQAQRASKAPYSSENINPKDAIVKFGVGGLAAGTTLSQAKRALAAKHKQMAEEQALEEAYSPVDMAIAGITGGATLGLKAVSALADPFINYAMDKMLGD